MQVGKDRRITIPTDIDINHGDELIITSVSGDEILFRIKRGGPKVVLYAAVIGCTEFCRWWGVILDSDGVVICKSSAQSKAACVNDITCSNRGMITKVKHRLGSKLYETPVPVSMESPEAVRETVKIIREKFSNKIWPQQVEN